MNNMMIVVDIESENFKDIQKIVNKMPDEFTLEDFQKKVLEVTFYNYGTFVTNFMESYHSFGVYKLDTLTGDDGKTLEINFSTHDKDEVQYIIKDFIFNHGLKCFSQVYSRYRKS